MATAIREFDPKDMAQHPDSYFRREYVWELPVRISHWVNAACLIVLFLTGIYISHPILAPSGEAYKNFVMGRVRQIHFISAMVFMVSFLVRVYWFWMETTTPVRDSRLYGGPAGGETCSGKRPTT